eukprot:jgi/Tetstr1/436419/TSEL_025249.t1
MQSTPGSGGGGAPHGGATPALGSPPNTLGLGSSAKRPRTSATWARPNPYQPTPPQTAPASLWPAGSTPGSGGAVELCDFLAARKQSADAMAEQLAQMRAREASLTKQVKQLETALWEAKDELKVVSARQEAEADRWRRDEAEMEKALGEANLRAVAATRRAEQLAARASEAAGGATQQEALLRDKLLAAEAALSESDRKLTGVQAQLVEERTRAKDAARRSETALEAERGLLGAADRALQHSEGDLGRLQEQLARAEARAAAAEQKCALQEAAGAAQRQTEPGANQDELQVLRRELQAAQVEAAQVKVLRQHVANIDLLREQLASEEARCRRLQEQLDSRGDAQLSLAEAQSTLALWQSAAASLGADCRAPQDLPLKVAEMQREALRAAEAQGAAALEERRLTLKVREAESALAVAASKEAAAAARTEGAEVRLARERRRAELLERERDGLKRIVASYDAEREQAAAEGQAADPQALRVKEAEDMVEVLRDQVSALEASLAAQTGAEGHAQSAKLALETRLAESQRAVARLEAEAVQLGAEVSLLNERLGRGEFNKSKTKVLHFIANPEAAALQEAEAAALLGVTAERDALAAQVTELQAALQAAGSAPAAAAALAPGAATDAPRRQAVLEAEVVVLKRQVAEVEKRELRLKEVFRERIQAFREACYQLFGYRVDMTSEASSRGAGTGAATSFVLKPAKADSKEDQLLFRFSQAGGMEMLDTPFTSHPSRQQEVQTFIHKFRSIPAFTANLTMELFQKQTQC